MYSIVIILSCFGLQMFTSAYYSQPESQALAEDDGFQGLRLSQVPGGPGTCGGIMIGGCTWRGLSCAGNVCVCGLFKNALMSHFLGGVVYKSSCQHESEPIFFSIENSRDFFASVMNSRHFSASPKP
jgi:hypothetical protein